MRDLFTLAALLGTTVAALVPALSAQEFERWRIWMDAHQIGPTWAAHHRAEQLAAAYNGGTVKHRDNRPFTPADFAAPDPWASAQPLTAEQERQRLAAQFAQLQAQQDT